jgi:hypothetical protein
MLYLVVRLASSRITKLSSVMHLETSGHPFYSSCQFPSKIQDKIMHAFEAIPVIPFRLRSQRNLLATSTQKFPETFRRDKFYIM